MAKYIWEKTYEKLKNEESMDANDWFVLRQLINKSFLFGKKLELKDDLLIKLFCKKDPDEEEKYTKKCALRTLEERVRFEQSLKTSHQSILNTLTYWWTSTTFTLLVLMLSFDAEKLGILGNSLGLHIIVMAGCITLVANMFNIFTSKSSGYTIGYLLGLFLLWTRMEDLLEFTISGYAKYCLSWAVTSVTLFLTLSITLRLYKKNTFIYRFIINEFCNQNDREEVTDKETVNENKETDTNETNKKYMIKMADLGTRVKDYPELTRVMSCFDATVKFEALLELRKTVPDDLYAFYARSAYQMNTRDASLELLLNVFKDVDKNLLMSKEEMQRYDALPEYITIYRGTKPDEENPRLSWSLKEEKAMNFYQGRLFRATIKKDDIIAYFSDDTPEEEILAHVTNGFEIIA